MPATPVKALVMRIAGDKIGSRAVSPFPRKLVRVMRRQPRATNPDPSEPVRGSLCPAYRGKSGPPAGNRKAPRAIIQRPGASAAYLDAI